MLAEWKLLQNASLCWLLLLDQSYNLIEKFWTVFQLEILNWDVNCMRPLNFKSFLKPVGECPRFYCLWNLMKGKDFFPGKWLTCRWKRLLISQIWMPKKIGGRKIIYWSREMCQGSCLDKQAFRSECWLNILSKNKIKPKSAPWMYSRDLIETLSISVFDLSETWRSTRKCRDIQLNRFSTCTTVKITLLTDEQTKHVRWSFWTICLIGSSCLEMYIQQWNCIFIHLL